MALINCKVVEESLIAQTPGESGIAAYELFIEPDDGYSLAAADFTDNTYETFSSYVQGIIDFGSEGKLLLTDTTIPYTTDNKVKITINLHPNYSITEDTTITVDIDGEAVIDPSIPVSVFVLDEVSNEIYGDSSITLENGVTLDDSILTTPYHLLGWTKHIFTYTGTIGTETKLATIILKATNPNMASSINYLQPAPGGTIYPRPWIRTLPVGFNVVHTPVPDIGSSDEAVDTLIGVKPIEKYFELWYTPQADMDNASPSNGMYIHAIVETTEPANRSLSITNITTNLSGLSNGSFNVIPYSGITVSNPPVVKVHGEPGAKFKVEFKESKVVENVSTGRSTITGGNSYFDGIIPNMPTGTIVIPRSGVYSFSMPLVDSFTTTGWKEFEMKITAGVGTTIKSSAVKTGGTSINIGENGSVVTNKFYQYPKVNIAFVSGALPAGWGYTTGYEGTTQLLLDFGGSSSRYGVVSKPPSSNPRLPNTTRVYNFEVRVTDIGTFSLNTDNTKAIIGATSNSFSRSLFVATEKNNRDSVSFSNLKAHIGQGLSDSDNNFATITGTIRCNKFGLGNQVYTIDLSEIFNFA